MENRKFHLKNSQWPWFWQRQSQTEVISELDFFKPYKVLSETFFSKIFCFQEIFNRFWTFDIPIADINTTCNIY